MSAVPWQPLFAIPWKQSEFKKAFVELQYPGNRVQVLKKSFMHYHLPTCCVFEQQNSMK